MIPPHHAIPIILIDLAMSKPEFFPGWETMEKNINANHKKTDSQTFRKVSQILKSNYVESKTQRIDLFTDKKCCFLSQFL